VRATAVTLGIVVSLTLLSGWVGPTATVGARTAENSCSRPAPGSVVPEPRELRSQDGVLRVELAIRNNRAPGAAARFCYVLPDGSEAPTLRLSPGDLLILRLKNELVEFPPTRPATAPRENPPADASICRAKPRIASDPCTSGAMTATSTNIHFHGLTVPSRCHQDDVLKTSIQPTDAPFEYRFQIPPNEPPGLYWYHPHIHGFSSKEVQGGASGALIIEGLERAIPTLAGLPERVLIIRDHELINPNAPPSPNEPAAQALIDRDGDAANNGTGAGKPAKDLSVNFVSVPYPDYPPALVTMKPGERQLWRLLNASSVTYLNIAALFKRGPRFHPEWLGVVAIDGSPLHAQGASGHTVEWRDSIVVPPGARVEFIMTGPPAGVAAMLVTRTVNTGEGGENDPNRTLVSIIGSPDALEPYSSLPVTHAPLPPAALPWLGDVVPTRVRKLYFSEDLSDPGNPNSDTHFYITVEGQAPVAFDPMSDKANIVTKQGEVEDWIIENRTTELHTFHIHQLHFQLVDWLGLPVNEPFLRDTVSVPFFNGGKQGYPSVRLRLDFRDPNTVGTFLYHCHLLDHEDAGMMGLIRVDPAGATSIAKPHSASQGLALAR
jgi:FtsP/CotA-like multicopper oxidase with cupredoxin domain